MSRITIDIILWLAMLLAAHQHHFQLKLHPPGPEPRPVVCNAQAVCH